MKKTAVLAASILFASAGFAGQTMNAQLAVQNDTTNPLVLHCVTRSDVVVASGLAADGGLLVPVGGTAMQFTFSHFSKIKPLISCTVANDTAAFAYLVLTNDKETMSITPSSGAYNFHYDPDYTGSVVYQ